eukprot:SAG11_NODE_212_length_12275_cov_5.098308_12_plen_76_part_00
MYTLSLLRLGRLLSFTVSAELSLFDLACTFGFLYLGVKFLECGSFMQIELASGRPNLPIIIYVLNFTTKFCTSKK